MKGRRPDPARVKLLRNNPGGRGLNFNEPKHADIETAVPHELRNEHARAEWLRVIGPLSRGHVQLTERPILLAYCQKYGEWIELITAADNEPMIVKGSHGGQILNPLRTAANRAYYLFIKAAQELGLTPATRSRIVVQLRDDEHAGDEFTKFQRRRKHA